MAIYFCRRSEPFPGDLLKIRTGNRCFASVRPMWWKIKERMVPPDGKVYLSERLKHTQSEVKKFANGKQKATACTENISFGRVIY
jgi:hypothetical protein